MAIPKPRPSEALVREFSSLGRYRVRLLRNPRSPDEPTILDIRECVQGDMFTRRGIKITSRAEMDLLRDILQQVLTLGL